MSGDRILSHMEMFFMALADKTRLRLLNLMRDEEVCVCFFTDVLGVSQPKISRHLAYLRKAGVVTARRDGKWMHYSISQPRDPGAQRVLAGLFEWMGTKEQLISDREKYEQICCTPETLAQIARTPITFISPQTDTREVDPAAAYDPAHNELDEFLL